MSSSRSWFLWSIVFGFLLTNFLAVAGIFAPGAVLNLLGTRLATEPVWPAFAFLLTFLVSWFYLPAAFDPLRHWPNAILSVVSRFAFAVFWLGLYPHFEGGHWPWIGWLELLLGAVQLILLGMVRREALIESTSPRI